MSFALIFASVVATTSFKNVLVTKVRDGDTLSVHLPGEPTIFADMGVRILGYDSPEIHSKRACEKAAAETAKANLEDLVALGRVDLLFCKGDKYWRLLCNVRIADKWDVTTQMIDSGNGVPYFGEKKIPYKCHKKDSK